MKQYLEEIKQNIAYSVQKAGRRKEDITLVAVSKTYPKEAIQQAYNLGCRDFGESKVQEFLTKVDDLPKDIKWHFIGHLQTNKVKYLIGKVELIHSVDSLKLLKEIEKQSQKKDLITNVLLEVNVARENSKYGFMIEEIPDLLKQLTCLKYVRIKGLMTIAPYVEQPEENIEVFQELFRILVDMQKQKLDNISIDTLSMGMSNDYMIAIEEGATMIRVGTALFGERDYS